MLVEINFTLCREVFMPTLISLRITGSVSGFNSFSRCDSAVSVTSRPTDAVPRKISMPSRLRHADRANGLTGLRLLDAGLHLFAFELPDCGNAPKDSRSRTTPCPRSVRRVARTG